MSNKAPIGILDSGIGGLTVWSEIVRLVPYESTIYYADSANCPYGIKEYPEIIALTEKIVEQLIARNVKMIVIACNTITAASITQLRGKYPEIPFVGMEPAIKPASRVTKSGIIGILATKATFAGEIYHNTASNITAEVRVIETAGTGLVEIIEQGLENTPQGEALTRKYIEPMIEQGADCVVLGCTHYPMLTKVIDRIAEGKLTIINPAPAVARRVKSLLEAESLSTDSHSVPNHIFLSSAGEESAAKVEKKAMEFLHDI